MVDRNLFACYCVLNIYFLSRNRFLKLWGEGREEAVGGREVTEATEVTEAAAEEVTEATKAEMAEAEMTEGRRRGKL